MQSFYRRFVRDYLRYKDEIQCAGAELVGAVRADAKRIISENPYGEYYALHIRRGDFQFKVRRNTILLYYLLYCTLMNIYIYNE